MFLPNELLSDISNFIPDDDVKNLTLLSRAFATVTAKRLPILSVKNKILSKFRRAQWPPVRIMMAKHNYDPRWHSPNVDWEETKLSFCSGDLITVYGEMNEDGFYFGDLYGVRGLVPSNFLDPTILTTSNVRTMMAKWDYDPRRLSPNVDGEQCELSFYSGDLITVYGEMDEDGFYCGELNGARGLVPSNFLGPTIPNTTAHLSPQAKAWIYSFYQYEFYPYMAAQNRSVPTKILSDITNFIPDGDVKNLGVVSREFSYVISKRCAIIRAKNKILLKSRRAQWPRARIMIAKWDYNPRVPSRNVDGEKLSSDRITIFSDVDEDGFYLGELNGARGKVPSNFLEPADPNTPRVLISPQAKAWIFSFYPYMAARNRVCASEIISDISNFIPNHDMKKLGFLSRPFAAVITKKLPIIKAKNNILLKIRQAQCPTVRTMMAKWDYDARRLSPNVDGEQIELSFRKGDKITINGEMDEDGFYLGELNGVRGLVPSNFLDPTILNTPNTLMLSPAKASAQSHSRHSGLSNRYTNHKTQESRPKIMIAKWDYDARHQSPNVDGEQVELSFCSGDLITVYGEMDEDGFYFGELNGLRGLVPSNFLQPAGTEYALMPPQAKASAQSHSRHSNRPTNHKTQESRPKGIAFNKAPAKNESAEATAPSKTMSQSSVASLIKRWELLTTSGEASVKTNIPSGKVSPGHKNNCVTLPNEVLSDISDFLPNNDVEDLAFLSRAFATVTAKRFPVINEKYKSPIERHIDVDELFEDYAWRMFDLARQKKNSNLKKYKDMRKEEAAFNINRNGLSLSHDDPTYRNVQQTEHRPSTVSKSMFTNNTRAAQSISWKTEERTSESVFEIVRLQGYTFGAKAKLSLKIPRLSNRYTNHKTQESRPKIMIAKWDYDARHQSPNVDGEQVELSFCSGDLITVYGEDGFYFGELNGLRGLVPSNFLQPAGPSTEYAFMPPQAKASAQSHSRHSGQSNRYTNHKTQESRPKGMAFNKAPAKNESAEATAPIKKVSRSSVASLVKRWELLTTSGESSSVASPVKTNIPSGEASPGYEKNCVTLPNEVLSDISDFLPNDDVEDLIFLSRAFMAVTAKRLPVINEKYKSPIERHIDVDELFEDYAWRMFDLARQKENSNLKKYKDMEKEEAAFNINRNGLSLSHDDPTYRNVQQTEHRPSTVSKSMFTNNTRAAQSISWKTEERTSESVFEIVRLQGYTFGAKAKLSLKIPREIAEFKTGFKYETHFNSLADNVQSETQTWGISLEITAMVPARGQVEASLVCEMVSYSGHYTLVSTLSGEVTVNITRAGVLIHQVTFNVASAFQHYLAKPKPRLKRVATMDHGKVKLTSKGTCHFQFALRPCGTVIHKEVRGG